VTEAATVEADPRERFRGAKFVLLTSYKRDGTGVPTQMWCVYDGGRLYVRTASTSYKVKRLARNPTVEVAPCDLRGDPTSDSFQARAERQPANEAARIAKLFARSTRWGTTPGSA
jgi:PPOX class probable F420-dependent enzyme